jgi:hypothetical protein
MAEKKQVLFLASQCKGKKRQNRPVVMIESEWNKKAKAGCCHIAGTWPLVISLRGEVVVKRHHLINCLDVITGFLSDRLLRSNNRHIIFRLSCST